MIILNLLHQQKNLSKISSKIKRKMSKSIYWQIYLWPNGNTMRSYMYRDSQM